MIGPLRGPCAAVPEDLDYLGRVWLGWIPFLLPQYTGLGQKGN